MNSMEELKLNLVWRRKEDKRFRGGSQIGRMIMDKSLNVVTMVRMICKGLNLEKNEDLEIIELDRRTFVFNFR